MRLIEAMDHIFVGEASKAAWVVSRMRELIDVSAWRLEMDRAQAKVDRQRAVKDRQRANERREYARARRKQEREARA